MSVLLHELVRIEILSRSLTSCNQAEMVAEQRARIWQCKNGIDEHCECHPFFGPPCERLPKAYAILVGVYRDVRQCEGYKHQRHHRAEADICEEVAIISPSNAVVEPHTVMILGLDAVIA